ncbi:MAG: polysaccharide export protein [Chlamydiales bacterium]|nr:polysaccharide export protein [Chlamydiia bacterium]MCP5508759.1 polysaccharide export protein [Chlamydiales bacterium]
MSRISAIALHICLAVTLLTVLSGCCCDKLFELPCCNPCRRPQVMEFKQCCVIDYNPCLADPCAKPDDEEEESDLLDENNVEESGEFTLSPGDIVELSIFGDSETQMDNVPVAPDGRIYYGFADGVPAAGKTLSEVREEITQQVSSLYISPKVSISLREAVNKYYRILGRVEQPGRYPILGALKLREAIGQAGGLLRENFNEKTADARLFMIADLDKSFLMRKGRKIKVNFLKLLFTCDDKENIDVQAGDYIYIAPNKAMAVYVLGAVSAPSRIPYDHNMTLSEAIARSGGWMNVVAADSRNANMTKVIVIRGRLECPRVAVVDYLEILNGGARDFVLMPGDIVYVQNKPFRFLRELVRLIAYTFVQSFGISAGRYYGEVWFPSFNPPL